MRVRRPINAPRHLSPHQVLGLVAGDDDGFGDDDGGAGAAVVFNVSEAEARRNRMMAWRIRIVSSLCTR